MDYSRRLWIVLGKLDQVKRASKQNQIGKLRPFDTEHGDVPTQTQQIENAAKYGVKAYNCDHRKDFTAEQRYDNDWGITRPWTSAIFQH